MAAVAAVPGLRPGHPAMARLVSGDVGAFGTQVWGRSELLSRAADLPCGFTDLLSAAAVDELVAERGLRAPFLRVAQDGTTLGDRAFTAGGGVGATIADQVSDDALLRLFADGATMVLQGLHRSWAPLMAFSQQLAADLGHPVQANAYVTPPQSRGFDDHYDVHDVFVLQVDGEKRWRVRPPVHDAPLRDQPWTDRRAAVQQAAEGEPLLDVVLRPGDCLYLPRGYLHSATALGGVSIHLTLGVHVWTRHTVAEVLFRQAVDAVADDPAVRASLPLGVDVTRSQDLAPAVDAVRDALVARLRDLTADDVAQALAQRARGAQRAAPVRPLAQLAAAASLDATGALLLRDHLLARLEPTGQGAVLRSRAGLLTLGADDVAPVQRLLDGGSADVRDLGTDLARRLVLAGVARRC